MCVCVLCGIVCVCLYGRGVCFESSGLLEISIKENLTPELGIYFGDMQTSISEE